LNVYLDSSALAKRYVDEAGSDHVEQVLSAASSAGVSAICLPEVISGLCRLRREGKLSARQYTESKGALMQNVQDSVIILITDQVVARAVELLEH
jgi:predicted nucleic acid-binding protein